MYIAGFFIMCSLLIGGGVLLQTFFYMIKGRFLWRAILPLRLRLFILPNDKVKMDSFKIFEEWGAIMFFMSCLMLPIIALNIIGFVKFF